MKSAQPLPPGPVTRCCCYDVSFRDLKDLAAATGADLTVLGLMTGCGTGCGTCRPYIRVMLKTGQTELPVLTDAQVRRILGEDAADR